MILTRRGAEVPKTDAAARAKILRELTVAPLSLNDPFPKKFKVYVDSAVSGAPAPGSGGPGGGAYVVPIHWARTALPASFAAARDVRAPAARADFPAFRGSLRADLRQPEAVDAVLASLKSTGGAMLCLPPGHGKTASALYVAARVRKKTLVLVHKSFLKDQWIERIAQFLPGTRVTCVQGDECDLSGDIVIGMLQTLISRKYPASTFAEVGLVVVDEVHHIAAAAFSTSMFSLAAPYALGLTATPDRKDGLGRVVEWFMGPVAFRQRRENQAGTRVDVVRYSAPRYAEPPPVNRRGDVCFTSVVTELTRDPARTTRVADEVCRMAATGRDVLVLSHRRQHCKDIAAEVGARGVDCATYLGGDKAAPDTRVIVATYSLTSEGFDMPRLTALVLATPASDVEQSCGRVMRGSAGTGAVIVDFVDHWGVCFAQHAKRRGFYKRSGFDVGDAAAGAAAGPASGDGGGGGLGSGAGFAFIE